MQEVVRALIRAIEPCQSSKVCSSDCNSYSRMLGMNFVCSCRLRARVIAARAAGPCPFTRPPHSTNNLMQIPIGVSKRSRVLSIAIADLISARERVANSLEGSIPETYPQNSIERDPSLGFG